MSRRPSYSRRRTYPVVGYGYAEGQATRTQLRHRTSVAAHGLPAMARPARSAVPGYGRALVWQWGCMLVLLMACVGMCGLTAFTAPLAFRGLPDEAQRRLAARIPVLEAWVPTRDPRFEVLPTLEPTRAALAAAMLMNAQGDVNPQAPVVSQPDMAAFPPTPVLGMVGAQTATAFLQLGQPPATATPRATPTIVLPTATTEPLPASYKLSSVQRERQGWNNCGPANLVMGLQAAGLPGVTQDQTAGWLKPNYNDANVSPWQMAAYVNQNTGLRAVARVNGDLELLRRLVFAGFGVIIETGLYDHTDGQWLGHYQTVIGWDDLAGNMLVLDSYLSNGPDGTGRPEPYTDLDRLWKHFNRLYMVIYNVDQEARLQGVLGTAWDARQNATEALNRALQEAQFDPNDAFAWFNAGSSYAMLEQWQQAAVAFDRARSIGNGLPWRMLWYQFGPFVAYYNVGDYRTVVDLANAVINQIPYIEEAYYYRGIAYLALGMAEQGRADLEHTLQFNRNFSPAQSALSAINNGQKPLPANL
ncbi:MAG: C39 family peptidase [Anaerolineae bacterium]|nr:C39 family peptidase [Anaerolineae bacterium]